MPVLYVDEQGAIIRKEGGHLVVKCKDRPTTSVPVSNLKQVVVIGNVLLTTCALELLASHSVDLVILSYYGHYIGRFQGELGGDVSVRKQQYAMAANPEFCLRFARQIVRGKLSNMRTLLLRYNRKLKDTSVALAIAEIERALACIDEATSLAQLQGYEGSASKSYFSAFKPIVKTSDGDALNFSKRSRRPPADPINVLLSFSYALLTSLVNTAVCIVGLDPYQGFFHQDRFGRSSLALDLMEEFRPVIADSVVLRLVNSKIITDTDFAIQDGDVRLSERGKAMFFKAFRQRITTTTIHPHEAERTSYERCVELQARYLVRILLSDEHSYQPFTVR